MQDAHAPTVEPRHFAPAPTKTAGGDAGQPLEGTDMSDRTYAVSEIVGTSTIDLYTAIKNGVARANRTLRNLDWFELVNVRGAIHHGEVNHYQVTLKVGFRLEG